MASLALVRALSLEARGNKLLNPPRRVPSYTLIDRMKTIPEDQLLIPSPAPRKKNYHSYKLEYTNRGGSILGQTQGILSDPAINEENTDCCEERTCHTILVSFLAIMTVLCMVTQVVSLPLYTASMSDPDTGDPFIASFIATMWGPLIFFSLIFFFAYIQNPKNCVVFRPCAPWPNIIAAGILGGLAAILIAFTSLPNRTHPGLQAILQQISIPCTVFTRFLILRKGKSA